MARRLWALCRTSQWTALKKCSFVPTTSLLSRQLCLSINETPLPLLSGSHFSTFICLRSQHYQSADSDEVEFRQRRQFDTRRRDYDRVLDPIISAGEPLTTEEWTRVKNEVMKSASFLTNENIDGIIMGMCVAQKQFDVGTSLLDSLIASGVEPNIATLGRYLRLCYLCEAGSEDTLLKICDDIRKRCPALESTTAENLIHGLARTSRWQEGFDILSEIKLSTTPSPMAFNVLAEAAFRNGELKKGWEIMEEMLQLDRRPSPPVYNAWIDQCLRTKGSEANVMIGQLLNFWADHDLRPSLEVAEHLRNWFESENYSWEGCFTAITPRGSCQNCRTLLRKQRVSDEEFKAMRDQFFETVIVGSNVFLKTNPEELETFQQFLSRTAPYDVVIDGLNVAYSTGRLNPHYAVKTLESVVQHFASRRKRMLVLGRRHMQDWPHREMNYVHEHASVFLAQNLSQDDPFLLYATMYSGPHTQFVSKDLMRSHLYLLKDPSLRRIFRRWQQQRQLQVYRTASGEIIIPPPLNYNPSVQQGPGAVWHIPYDKEFKSAPKHNEPPRLWLCLKKVEDNE